MVRPQSLLSPAERAAQPVSREWLVGDWAWAGSPSGRLAPEDRARVCGPEPETALFADGTYRMGDGAGHWSLQGSRLTMRLEREPSIWPFQVRLGDPDVARIRKLGPDEIAIRWRGTPEARFVRCD